LGTGSPLSVQMALANAPNPRCKNAITTAIGAIMETFLTFCYGSKKYASYQLNFLCGKKIKDTSVKKIKIIFN